MPDRVLLESGLVLLLESGGSALLESSVPPPDPSRPRHQRGTVASLSISPGRTDLNPVASIVGPGSSRLGPYRVPLVGGLADPTYRLSLRLPGGIALGTYQVTFSYSVSGVPGSSGQQFDVIAGGDSGGEVISLYSHDRPEARYVLAQIGAGRLVQGRNPHL